jgi:hypothetical protein
MVKKYLDNAGKYLNDARKNLNSAGKWISGGLGWALFGPIGGILGFMVGSMLDESQVTTEKQAYQPGQATTRGGYVVSLLVLVAAVMKADGKVLKFQLRFVRGWHATMRSALCGRQHSTVRQPTPAFCRTRQVLHRCRGTRNCHRGQCC